MNLVGIVGKKRSGKDTFASVLVARGWRRVAFADELKKEVAAWLGIEVEELERRKDEFRATLQERGVMRRREDPDHWIRLLVMSIAERTRAGGRTVVPDVRFQNEADWVRANGGVLVRTVRSGLPDDDDHISETEQDGIEVDETFVCASAEAVRGCAKTFLFQRAFGGGRQSGAESA